MYGMDTYKTPEGFELAKPLLFPDVRDFGELFTVDRAWDFATMNYRNGYAQSDTPKVITREGFDRVIDRFMSTRRAGLPNNFCVTPSAALVDAVFEFDGPFVFFDRVGWELVAHESNGRVLIIGQANGIIASRYIAYVDPATIPQV